MNEEKLKVFAALFEQQQKEQMIAQGFTLEKHGNNYDVSVKPGAKYTKVDIGRSGRFMVVNDTGEIFGIKGYGVIHRGHPYGTLDTINEWYWGDYHPVRVPNSVNVYWRDIPASAKVEETEKGFRVCFISGATGVVFWHGHEVHEALKALRDRKGRAA